MQETLTHSPPVQATLQHLLNTTRHTGIGGIPISSSEPLDAPSGQLEALIRLAAQVERATEGCYAQRQTIRDGAEAVSGLMRGAGK